MTVPVTVLSGTLGAGKTTLLNDVLSADHGHEVAVLVNDMGEINVDAELVRRRVERTGETVELSNGCICCGMRGEFESAIIDLALNHEFDYLLVEPSGISEPAPVARQFVAGHASTFYDVSSVTTVVDARRFYDTFRTGGVERRDDTDAGDRPLSELVLDGVEFCDTLVINKTDLVTDAELDEVREMIRAVQPAATMFETAFGRVDPADVLGTSRFDPEAVAGSASWRRALDHHRAHGGSTDDGAGHAGDDPEHGDGSDDHAPERGSEPGDHDQESDDHDHDDEPGDHDHEHPPAVYGIDSFVYQRRRPMHPGRLADAVADLPSSVVRVKGYLHVAGRGDHALTLSRAGQRTCVEVAGRWIASLPDSHQERYRRGRSVDWDDRYGDRKTELAIIGRDVDRDAVVTLLDSCLLTDADPDPETEGLANPFPNEDGTAVQL